MAILLNFAITNLNRLTNERDITLLGREQINYAITTAAFTGDSLLLSDSLDGQLIAEESELGDLVLIDKSSLLASAAPVKIARRR